MDWTAQVAAHFETEIYIEFVCEPGLAEETGLEQLSGFTGQLTTSGLGVALNMLTVPGLGSLVSAGLARAAGGAEPSRAFTRAVADIVATLKDPRQKYESTCRSAICHAAIGRFDRAFEALSYARGVNDEWARHHHIYGLIHGARGAFDKARPELGLALQAEPFEGTRQRIRRQLMLLELAE